MPNNKLIDFDAWRTAHAPEGSLEPVLFRVGGKDYSLPLEPPASIVLDVIRLKKAADATDGGAENAEVSLDALTRIGVAMFGEANWQEILIDNRIGAVEMGDLIIQAFRAWPEHLTQLEDAVPNRRTRRRSPLTS